MDKALGVSEQNCLQWREHRPSPPVAHDCKDPLELGLVERHPATCHSRLIHSARLPTPSRYTAARFANNAEVQWTGRDLLTLFVFPLVIPISSI